MTTNSTIRNASASTARKAPVTHKDLAMAYLMAGAGAKGVAAISPMLANHTDPVAVLDKVIAGLETANQNVAELTTLRDEFADALTPGVKGRKPVAVGQTRAYSVQQIGDGDFFIRLPVGPLGVRKGDKVSVDFATGKVSVTAL